jgi:hypothetical protein
LDECCGKCRAQVFVSIRAIRGCQKKEPPPSHTIRTVSGENASAQFDRQDPASIISKATQVVIVCYTGRPFAATKRVTGRSE